MYRNLAILAFLVLSCSAPAGWFERTALTGLILFTLLGLALGPVGLGVLHFDADHETLRTMAELTLALVTDTANADLAVLLYAVLSLTLLRILPIYLALAGTGLKPGAKLFIGCPRGLASIVLATDLRDSRTLAMVVNCTVILSIFAHGLTANPLARMFGRQGMPAAVIGSS